MFGWTLGECASSARCQPVPPGTYSSAFGDPLTILVLTISRGHHRSRRRVARGVAVLLYPNTIDRHSQSAYRRLPTHCYDQTLLEGMARSRGPTQMPRSI